MILRPAAVLLVLLTGGWCASPVPGQAVVDYEAQRRQMVESQLAARDIQDPRVLQVMREVPRHLFVPEEVRAYAYADHPLPIAREQTISQPYIVALMTQIAETAPQDKALEVGTGSGYQAAVLSRLVSSVHTIEIIPELADRASATLRELGYRNVEVRTGDGYAGWPEEAPFDVILITASVPRIPEPLEAQLRDGGRMVAPLGNAWEIQELVLYRKKGGKLQRKNVIPVRFVPMTGIIEKGPD